MVCNKCGKINDEGQNFCRFCGASLPATRTQTYAPRPHSWASPSSPLHNVAGYSEAQQVQPLVQTPAEILNPHAALGYRCPHCGTSAPPQIVKKVSLGGWIVFVAMLFICLPLFWIGFLIKDEKRVCSMCLTKIG